MNKKKEMTACVWMPIDEDSGGWHATCGHEFYIQHGDTPESLGWKYCPWCGKSLTESEE